MFNIIHNVVVSVINKMVYNTEKGVLLIEKILGKEGGLTITELVKKSNLSRSAVRIILAKLDGARKVSIKRIGMAKVYSLK